jgi:phage-related tail protein
VTATQEELQAAEQRAADVNRSTMASNPAPYRVANELPQAEQRLATFKEQIATSEQAVLAQTREVADVGRQIEEARRQGGDGARKLEPHDTGAVGKDNGDCRR